MIPRHPGRHATCALLALVCALLALPGAALASSGPLGSGGGGLGSGGSGSTGSGTSAGATTTTAPTAGRTGPVSATADGVTLQTSSSGLQRGRLVFSGTASGDAGRTLQVQSRSATPGATWTPATRAIIAPDGTFRAVWRPSGTGRVAIRALVVTSGPAARAASADPTLTITVYPTSKATIYGPGFYGRRTACGGRLTRTMIGVANRTLPCGTKVSILYDGRTLTVPVIDRGPYANGADWDLTMATARALGIQGTSRIGTIALSTVATDGRTGRRHRRR